MNTKEKLSPAERSKLLATLKIRFESHFNRHPGVSWFFVEEAIERRQDILWALSEMERTGGEPDVVEFDRTKNVYVFYDCSAESPKGRRSVCYDREALDSRKEHKPENSAIDMAAAMGIKILTEEQYRKLQELGDFDTKTSSWILTPPNVRTRGGALFCDRRYDMVFTYHNGAESYYADRGFRGRLQV